MGIRKVTARHGGIILIPVEQIGTETEIVTDAFNASVIVYTNGEDLPELIRTIGEQRRLDERNTRELNRSDKSLRY